MSIYEHEYGSELCYYCPRTDYGTESVNDSPYNLCEGSHCDQAQECFLEETGEEYDENKIYLRKYRPNATIEIKSTKKRKIFLLDSI